MVMKGSDLQFPSDGITRSKATSLADNMATMGHSPTPFRGLHLFVEEGVEKAMALGIQIPTGGPFIPQASTRSERNGLHDHLGESHSQRFGLLHCPKLNA
jgi:hypothetical protein